MREFANLDELATATGTHLGYSDWHTITQEQINAFAEATGDKQWIHLDTERAKNGPFGTTIAHGYLTLSLIPLLGPQIYRINNLTMAINYGVNKVRFPAVIPAGSRIRGGVELLDITDTTTGKQALFRFTVELENSTKPACVAETVVLFIP